MDNTARIDRYLNGEMEAGEKRAFEAELATNAQLAEDLALQRDMDAFLRRKAGREALKSQLRDMSGSYFQTEKKASKIVGIPRRRLFWAAGIAAAAALAFFVLRPLALSPSYERYAQFPQLALAEKSAGTRDWSEAETAFNEGNYAAAEPMLEAYLEAFPGDRQAQLFLGICKMELDRHEEAREIFRGFADADPSLRDYAGWYLALSFLKTKDIDSCRAALKDIPASSGFYEEAGELLRRLGG
jgi:tetratricopeptide (TPR) repeat protein